MVRPGDSYTEDKKRVDTFYPNDWVTASSIFLVVAIMVAFGGIHCVGWSFTFPSTVERTVWRVASLLVVCIPVALPPLAIMTDRLLVRRFGSFFEDMIIVSVLFLYILGRLALLVLPVLCLRSLPPAAFHVVHWASFIPHI